MKTCIIGASGYSGRELVCLLLDHPYATLERVTSRSLEGKKVEDCIPKLRGKDCALCFTNPRIEELCKDENVELFFLALPHGTAAEYAMPLLEAGKKVIDLSADFRLNSPERYEEFYGQAHPAPEWLEKAFLRLARTARTFLGNFSLGCFSGLLSHEHPRSFGHSSSRKKS